MVGSHRVQCSKVEDEIARSGDFDSIGQMKLAWTVTAGDGLVLSRRWKKPLSFATFALPASRSIFWNAREIGRIDIAPTIAGENGYLCQLDWPGYERRDRGVM